MQRQRPGYTKNKIYKYKGWKIEGYGGFCTIRHFWASKDNLSFWQCKLYETKNCIDQLENGLKFSRIKPIYHKPLYT